MESFVNPPAQPLSRKVCAEIGAAGMRGPARSRFDRLKALSAPKGALECGDLRRFGWVGWKRLWQSRAFQGGLPVSKAVRSTALEIGDF
jgi:hypothetical protein